MSLNIKNEETCTLVREVARRTGESMTAAITEALREKLERLQREQGGRPALAERLLAVGRECSTHLPGPVLALDHGDLLYDERGLPR